MPTNRSRATYASVVFLCLFSMLAVLPAPAQQAAAPAAPQIASPVSDLSAQAAVVEKASTVYRFNDDGTGTKTETMVVKVQSEAGVQQLGTLRLGYSSANQKLDIRYVRVRKADGSVVSADPATAQDMTGPVARVAPMYSDYREKHIAVPALRPGDKLEYEAVTETTTPLAPANFWMEHDFNKEVVILDETLAVDVPVARKVQLKAQPEFTNYTTRDESGRRTYTWTYKNLETRQDREDREKRENPSKKPKKRHDEPSSVQLTTFNNWSELGAWYSKLEQERQQPSDEIKARVAELTKGLTSDREKIKALYDYVALNYRYISLSFGVGRYQPHASAEVFKNEYGDCKDKHTLLAAMLRAAGFHLNTVLIHSQHRLDPDVPSPSQFDHVIGNLKLGDETIWLDTTAETAPMGMLVLPLRSKMALQIAPDATTTLVQTPEGVPVEQQNVFVLEGKLTELGRLQAHVTRTLRGDQEVSLRSAFRGIGKDRWNSLVEYLSNYEGLAGRVSDVKLSDLGDTAHPLVLEYDLEIDGYFDWAAKDSKIPIPVPHMVIPDLDVEDVEPAVLGGLTSFDYQTKITVPASVALTLPLPVTVKRDYAEYSAGATLKDGVLTTRRYLKFNAFDLPPLRGSDLTAFTRIIRADEGQQVLAKVSGDAALVASKQATPEELEEAAMNAFNSHKYEFAAQLYLQLTEKEPRHPRAWDNLGRAYAQLGQYTRAEAALKKAIEVNPYGEFSYDLLGEVYAQQERFEDAIAQYRKQLEVNPLDKYAHSNLGQALIRLRRYPEAVPELESATQISPDAAFNFQMLGEAYLHTGKIDEAMKAFDHALEKQSEPMIWNNIAYTLACEKQGLDRAQQYAESAVSSTSALLRNLALDQADWQGASLSGQLATYWDTLGWVYFQKGDLAAAEKWLYAAWVNTQHGEVGDHLAQLYQKQGLREKAIETYALSMAGRRTVPETRGHFKTLVNDDAKIDKLVTERKPTLLTLRTVTFKLPKAEGKAEAVFIFDAGGTVEQVRFREGGDAFTNFQVELRKLKLPVALPDATTAHYVRWGSLRCTKGDCTLVLVPADENNLGEQEEKPAGQ